jgi:pimeloyl-ACP methyl ester carboxylesterase
MAHVPIGKDVFTHASIGTTSSVWWQAAEVTDVLPPRLEGTVAVARGRRLGFAEFGPPDGRPVVWLHGTPGARRQIPAEARALAEVLGLRIVGVDRPGIGSSTPHLYRSIADFEPDLTRLLDSLGIGRYLVIGLSGGGPYALAAAHAQPERVVAAGILGGVAPTVGVDAIDGGLVSLGRRLAPAIALGRVPLGVSLSGLVRVARPLASPALEVYARLSPEGDRRLLARPEFKAMFLDDLINGSRKQLSAPLADVLLFSRHWGFEVDQVAVPVRWWHGDADHIIPFGHGVHMVDRLPDAELIVQPGESHLAGLGVAEDILTTLQGCWEAANRKRAKAARAAARRRAVSPSDV